MCFEERVCVSSSHSRWTQRADSVYVCVWAFVCVRVYMRGGVLSRAPPLNNQRDDEMKEPNARQTRCVYGERLE